MLGRELIMKAKKTFVGLIPGSADWMLYWSAYPEQQDAMLAYMEARRAKIKDACGGESLIVIDNEDTVMAYSPSHFIHDRWPYQKHRRTYVIVLTPGRREIVLRKREGVWTSAASRHVYYKENYFEAAVRALEEKIGIEHVHKGKLKKVVYEKLADAWNDWEASEVYTYVLPNLTELASSSKITSIPIEEFLQSNHGGTIVHQTFLRLCRKAAHMGGLRWKK